MSEAWKGVRGDLGSESRRACLVQASDSLLGGVHVWVGLSLLVDTILAIVLFSLHMAWWIIFTLYVVHVVVVVVVGLKRIRRFKAEMAQRGMTTEERRLP